jgi:lipopolysaccharide transport system permease protein
MAAIFRVFIVTVAQIKERPASLPKAKTEIEPQKISLWDDLAEFWKQRTVLVLLTKRDISSRHKGSMLGKLWPILHPLGQLCIYTFVFSIILKIKFGTSSSTENFAIYLMTGMIPWAIFSESVSRACTVILENPNLITKVVFPTEILPLVNVASALSTQALAFSVLVVSSFLVTGQIHSTICWIPLVILPLVFFSAGLSWLLASLGVFVRDTRHILNLILQAGMYATPIFYPTSSIPSELKWIAQLNPLAGIIDDLRRTLIEGRSPNWESFLAYSAISTTVLVFGLIFFLKTKRTFADVM